MGRRLIERASAALFAILLSGCAQLEGIYKPAQTVPLAADAVHADTSCTAAPEASPPPYDFEDLKDCTSQQSLVVFAFSGGGTRSASFGYGALKAAHAAMIPDAAGAHPFDRDIDIVSGVSGGSFTAAAYANQRDKLFPAAPGAPDYYRDNFLTHNFFSDLISIYLAPWHWQWMLPGYATNDEMAKVYANVDFSSSSDKLFAPTFGDLAKKGRPLLVIQATDFGNEQPFIFTQNDFDLICSDVNAYPVGNAIAASSAFPVLFSPIQLTNHHFTPTAANRSNYCHAHRPAWVNRVLASEPEDLSRSYVRAKEAENYLPPKEEPAAGTPPAAKPQFVYLQDGGVTDNVALRGLMNIMALNLEGPDPVSWSEPARAAACRTGLGRIDKVLIVAVDGEARPNNQVSSLPYLSDIGLILNVATSAAIDSNGFETMAAAEAMTKKLAAKLENLNCTGVVPDAVALGTKAVNAYFARVSFADLADETRLDPGACGKSEGTCLLGDLARSATSLDFTGPQVDALIEAGRSAFLCNPKIGKFLRDSKADPGGKPAITCERPPK